jgi:hypothetical protein
MDHNLFTSGLPDLLRKRIFELTGLLVDFKDYGWDYPLRRDSAGPFTYRGQAFRLDVCEDTVRIEWCRKWYGPVLEVYRGHGPEAVGQECLRIIDAIFGPPEVLENVAERSERRRLQGLREAAWKTAWKL